MVLTFSKSIIISKYNYIDANVSSAKFTEDFILIKNRYYVRVVMNRIYLIKNLFLFLQKLTLGMILSKCRVL